MNRFITYLQNVKEEVIHKIEWTKWDDLQRLIPLIAITTVILSIICFGVDWVFVRTLRNLYLFFFRIKS